MFNQNKENKKKQKILIIDDEKDLCFVIRKNLELSGDYKVIVATSGAKGLLAARWHKPDLILLDIMMPHMDGFEVLKRIKENRKTMSISVIMLTAKSDDDSKVRAATLYDEYYIVKPVEMEVLRSRIKEVLSLNNRHNSGNT